MLNNILCLSTYLIWAWIVPSILLPFAIIHRIFGKKTDYWKLFAANGTITYLGVKIVYINNQKRLEQGFFLANHRSFTDFFIDTILSESTVISRHLATACVLPGAILSMIDGRFISINRNKSRDEIFNVVKAHLQENRYYSKRILFFPEGTRKSHTHLDSVEMLKPGLLKSIYEYKKMPIQLQITKNKECVLNERKVEAHYGVTVYTSFSKPIYPENYTTFDDFYKHICSAWFEQFNETMSYTE